MTTALRLLRVLLLALAVVAAWPVLVALGRGEVSWPDAVDLLFTTRALTFSLVVLVVCVAISFSRSPAVRTLAAVAVLAALIMVVTGRVSPGELYRGVDVSRRAAALESACGYTTTMERGGGTVRAVLKDPSRAGAVVGYVLVSAGDVVQRGLDGQDLTPGCVR